MGTNSSAIAERPRCRVS